MIGPVPARPVSFAAASAALGRLRHTATLLVALALLVVGVREILRPDPAVTTAVDRYLDTPRGRRAGGCMEAALALWLVSGRNPKLAPAVVAAAVAGLGLMAAAELRRDRPLPSGLGPAPAVALATAATRSELSVAVARQAFLVGLCVLSGVLTPPEAVEPLAAPIDRFA